MCTSQNARPPCDAKLYSRQPFCPAVTESLLHTEVCIEFLRRNLKHCPPKCKRKAYLSLVRSVLEYGCTVWDPYLQKNIDELERVQRRAIRFITGEYNYKSMTLGTIGKLQDNLQIPSLENRRKAIRLILCIG